jgi:hypothetical protein
MFSILMPLIHMFNNDSDAKTIGFISSLYLLSKFARESSFLLLQIFITVLMKLVFKPS